MTYRLRLTNTQLNARNAARSYLGFWYRPRSWSLPVCPMTLDRNVFDDIGRCERQTHDVAVLNLRPAGNHMAWKAALGCAPQPRLEHRGAPGKSAGRSATSSHRTPT